MRLWALVALSGCMVLAQEHPQTEHTAAGDAHAEESHGPSPVWKWANFAILAGLLGYGISKGAGTFFRNRNEEIRKALDEAERMRLQAEERAAEIDRRMANLESEMQQLQANSEREMKAESERVQAETARLLANAEQNASREIGAVARQATQELRVHAAQLAVELARKKVQARMDPATEGALVDGFLTMLRRPGPPVN